MEQNTQIQPQTALPKTPKIRVFTALVSQDSTSAPTLIILQDTIGITWTPSYDTTGKYKLTPNIQPLAERVTIELTNTYDAQINASAYPAVVGDKIEYIGISTADLTNNAAYINGVLYLNKLEIKLYEIL